MRTAALLLLLTLPVTLQAQRLVEDNRIISEALPQAVIEVADDLMYAGMQQFVLHDVADCEQHFFVELDGMRIKRLLLIQFEGFIEGVPNTYSYGGELVTHSGQSWYRGTAAVTLPAVEPRPDSDGARGRTFLRDKGWTLGPDIYSQRLVWLLDDPPKNEVIVIYTEDLADHGLTAADVKRGGQDFKRWPALDAMLQERTAASFKIIQE